MPIIREECAFEADRFVESVAYYENTGDEKDKRAASANAIDLIKCMLREKW